MAARRKHYHHGELRDALLDAARAELRQRGAEALALRAVARRAGVSHAAAYHHFASKDALLDALATDAFVSLEEALVDASLAVDRGGRDRLAAACLGYVSFSRARPELFALMFQRLARSRSGALASAATRTFERMLSLVTGARVAAGARGDPGADALLAWGAVHGLAVLAGAGAAPTLEAGPQTWAPALLARFTELWAVREDGASR